MSPDPSSDSVFALFQKVGVGVFIASASGLVFFGIVRLLLARAVTQAGEQVSRAERVVARAEAAVIDSEQKAEANIDRAWEMIAEAEKAVREANDMRASAKLLIQEAQEATNRLAAARDDSPLI